jgi:uncharacterized protein YjbI with pentapeptide repeats
MSTKNTEIIIEEMTQKLTEDIKERLVEEKTRKNEIDTKMVKEKRQKRLLLEMKDNLCDDVVRTIVFPFFTRFFLDVCINDKKDNYEKTTHENETYENMLILSCELTQFTFTNCIFKTCVFNTTSLVDTSFNNCTFLSCTWMNVDYLRSHFKDCSFYKGRMESCVFDVSNFINVNSLDMFYIGCTMTNVCFSGTYLFNSFDLSTITTCYFDKCDLSCVSFKDANVTSCILFECVSNAFTIDNVIYEGIIDFTDATFFNNQFISFHIETEPNTLNCNMCSSNDFFTNSIHHWNPLLV